MTSKKCWMKGGKPQQNFPGKKHVCLYVCIFCVSVRKCENVQHICSTVKTVLQAAICLPYCKCVWERNNGCFSLLVYFPFWQHNFYLDPDGHKWYSSRSNACETAPFLHIFPLHCIFWFLSSEAKLFQCSEQSLL